MTRRTRRGGPGVLAAALAACTLIGCDARGTGTPADPATAALDLVAIAQDLDAREADADRMFGLAPDAENRAALLDTLARLGRATGARVGRVEIEESIGCADVDLEVDLPGGGTERWTVRFAMAQGDPPRAEWLAGPGAEWPSRRSKDAGLSTSQPPD